MQISYLASSLVLAGVGVVLTLGACGGNTSSIVATPRGTLSSFSPRSNAVVGSEALLQLSGVDSPGSLTIAVNGANVDAQFRSDAEGRMLALVPSLRSGANSVEVTQSGRSVAKLELESYPTSGPIFLAHTNSLGYVRQIHLFSPMEQSCLQVTRRIAPWLPWCNMSTLMSLGQ